MIAALFVAKDGPYFGLPGIDPWDAERDARKYRGRHRVVAHPPCGRWGRYWSGGPNPDAARRDLGDDDGCFAHALWSVRTFGGVLEHPAHSAAWPWFGLPEPGLVGWGGADQFGGRSCLVYQGHYGHRAAKATFLYAVADKYPELRWGEPTGTLRLEEGFHSRDERARARCRDQASEADLGAGAHPHADSVSRSTRSYRRAKERGLTPCEFLSRKQRAVTPTQFRDVLITIAQQSD